MDIRSVDSPRTDILDCHLSLDVTVMAQEIERKFLVRNDVDYKSLAVGSSKIAQGYFAAVNTVRIRIRDEKGFLTIKGPSRNGGLSRYEFEKEITLEEARQLMQLCQDGVVEKTRYLVPVGNHTFEVDEFHGDNEGLVMAEVELGSEDEDYERPPFLGVEVTGDRRFYNSHLRQNPYSKWKDTIPEEYTH